MGISQPDQIVYVAVVELSASNPRFILLLSYIIRLATGGWDLS
jgi:hypothetical protein